jgi:anti-anti-sigma factor
MEITTSIVQSRVPVTVMRLEGDLDANSAESFNAAVAAVIEGGARDVLIDLSAVPFLSSAGIRSLHALYTQLHPGGSEQEKDAVYKGISAGTYSAPHLKLLKPTHKVEEVIKLSGLDMYLKMYTNESEALAAF